MVAKLFVRECAVVTAQEQMKGCSASERQTGGAVDLSLNVYAQYYASGGLRHVKCLRNSKPESGEHHLVWDAQRKSAPRRIFIAEDHLRIRLVRFVSGTPPTPPGRLQGARWSDIGLYRPAIPKLWTRSDVCASTVQAVHQAAHA